MSNSTVTAYANQQLGEAAAKIKSAYPHAIDAIVVLGSGLGDYAAQLQNATIIPYGQIPHFCESLVEGHAGNLVLGTLQHEGGKKIHVACMQGRFHFYEGHPMRTVTFPIRVLKALGAQTLLVTNAAGGVNVNFKPGTLMLISDHINLMGDNPLKGANAIGLDGQPVGPRFSDMTNAYTPKLRQHLNALAIAEGIAVQEGVYAAVSGPSYETPAEIRMMRTLGADAVGMSTAPEVIVAAHMGMQVAGISCITNAAAGITGAALTHEEVTETANLVKSQFMRLVHRFLLTYPMA